MTITLLNGEDQEIVVSKLNLGSILAGNSTYKGEIITAIVDDASTIFGDVLYCAADFHYDRADADADSTMPVVAMALVAGAGTNPVLLRGQVCNTTWNWSAGLIYADTATGKLTQTAPSGSGDQVQIVGFALSADTMYFNPQLVVVEIA